MSTFDKHQENFLQLEFWYTDLVVD